MNPLSKYALTMTPVALSIEELLPSTSQSNFVMLSMRTFLVFSTLVVALAVPFFGKISYPFRESIVTYFEYFALF